MNSLAWNPFREMEELLERYSRLTGRSISDTHDDLSAPDWTPFTDVEETPAMFLIHAELPGVRKQDITVCFSGSTLEIRGDKQAEMKDAVSNIRHRSERLFGQFYRTFNLPRNIDATSVSASYTDGVLTVRIPKTPQSEYVEQRIDIS